MDPNIAIKWLADARTYFREDGPHASALDLAIQSLRRREGEAIEIAEDFSCPDCGNESARGDASQIVYCGVCGREWHPSDADYPQKFRILNRP